MPLRRKLLFPRLARAGALALAVGIGCRDAQAPRSQPDPAGASLAALIVSNPAELGVATNPGATPGVVYASLPPGSVPDGESVVIETRGTGAQAAAAMVDGGFDPVPVAATAGDTLEIRITLAGTGEVRTYVTIVPERRPPVVVRTDPPPKRRDVPLNVLLRVVFSEPIDATTVSPGSVELLLEGAPVAGALGFGDAAHLTVTFTPADSLVGGAEYTLLVTPGIRDLDGDPLAAPLTTTFTTVNVTSNAPIDSGVFERVTPVSVSGQLSRYVFHEPYRFELQYDTEQWGSFAYSGAYVRADSVITFRFDANPGTWRATGTLRGDSLFVSYNLDMQLSDFEDGAYVRVAPVRGPSSAESRMSQGSR